MSEDFTADETPITFNVKSSSDAKYVLTVLLSTTVSDLKTKLSASEYADIPPDRQRLIYSGRVLKDADTLSVYKIKEGNTVHLVKGAASNQRQNPASQGSTSTSGAGATGAATGVPTNLAAGTGRDPLAGLTGARYAGYAQMPNANMFGPDGGMGPPPDPEHMASMLENPNFASTLNEALANPDVIDQMLRSNPMFQGPMAAQAREMLRDPNFRRMMTDPETLRNMSRMQQQMPGMFGGMGGARGANTAFPAPGVTDGEGAVAGGERLATGAQADSTPPPQPANPIMGMLGGAGAEGAANPFASLFNTGPMGAGAQANNPAPGATGTNTDQTQREQQQAANPFATAAQTMMQNPQLMQQMMASMGGGMNSNPSNPSSDPAQARLNPFAALQALGGAGAFGGAIAAPQDDRAPEDRYAVELRQLNDMGFHEFERNIEALRRTGGSVQGAVEYLLTPR